MNNIFFSTQIKIYLDFILRYLPIITFFFIFFSSAELYSFFNFFGINIFNYIGIEEIIYTFYTFFFEHLMGIFSISFVFLVSFFSEDKIKITFKKWMYLIIPFLAIALIIIKHFYKIYISSTYIEILASLPYLIIYIKTVQEISNIKIKTIVLFLFVFGYLAFKVGYLSKLSARDLIEQKSKIEISFLHSNKFIKTNSVIIYIGETSNHIFLYSKKSKGTFVFKKDEVKNLFYKSTIK